MRQEVTDKNVNFFIPKEPTSLYIPIKRHFFDWGINLPIHLPIISAYIKKGGIKHVYAALVIYIS